MSNQNKPYENDKGMNIRVKDFSDGSGAKIDFYSNNPQEDHTSIHMKIDYDNKSIDIIDNTSGEKEESHIDIGCFLTTACMRYYKNNFDDNCYELTSLRWFRDNFVSSEDIKHYYTLAPIIVDEINKLDGRDIIYKDIYENVIVSCINYIYNSDYKSVYEVYKKCILELEEKYVRPVLGQRLINVLKKKRDLVQIRECYNFSYDQENIDYIRKSLQEKDGMPEKVYRMVFPSNPCDVTINAKSRKICAESLLK